MSAFGVRPGRAADLDRLTEVYNHYVEHTAATFDLTPFTPAERREWFAQFAEQGPLRLLVGERDGRVVGFASSTPLKPKAAYRPSVETTIYVDPEAAGAQLGTGLYGALLDALVDAGVHRAYAFVTLPNAASVRLHEKLGYRQVGCMSECGYKFDRWWDVALFERVVV